MTMYKVEGVRSFSRGLVPSLLGTLPYTGIGFSLNERFKIWVRVNTEAIVLFYCVELTGAVRIFVDP